MPPFSSVHAPGTAKPVGHYSQAIVANGLVFVSGQVPSDLVTGTPNVGTIEEQTARSLSNVDQILKAAGSGLQHALQMTIFISRIDDWAAVNTTYARVMGAHKPARAIVPVSPLHFGTGIEIMCVAALPTKRTSRPKKPAATKPARRKAAARRPAGRKGSRR